MPSLQFKSIAKRYILILIEMYNICMLAIEPPCPIVSIGPHGDIVRKANAIRFVRT